MYGYQNPTNIRDLTFLYLLHHSKLLSYLSFALFLAFFFIKWGIKDKVLRGKSQSQNLASALLGSFDA